MHAQLSGKRFRDRCRDVAERIEAAAPVVTYVPRDDEFHGGRYLQFTIELDMSAACDRVHECELDQAQAIVAAELRRQSLHLVAAAERLEAPESAVPAGA